MKKAKEEQILNVIKWNFSKPNRKKKSIVTISSKEFFNVIDETEKQAKQELLDYILTKKYMKLLDLLEIKKKFNLK